MTGTCLWRSISLEHLRSVGIKSIKEERHLCNHTQTCLNAQLIDFHQARVLVGTDALRRVSPKMVILGCQSVRRQRIRPASAYFATAIACLYHRLSIHNKGLALTMAERYETSNSLAWYLRVRTSRRKFSNLRRSSIKLAVQTMTIKWLISRTKCWLKIETSNR